MKKIFLLDDHKIIRDGLRSILSQNQDFEVTGEEGDPVKFLEDIRHYDFDVLLLDLTFPEISGFDIIPKVRKLKPKVIIAILSMHKNPDYMQRSLLLGANCYLSKDLDAREMIEALSKVCAGGEYGPKLNGTPVVEGVKTSSQLSQRELEILRFIANGFSSKQIAADLGISVRTVEAHRLHIMKKLGTSNSAETISVALTKKIL